MFLAECASSEIAGLAALARRHLATSVEGFSATDSPRGLLILDGKDKIEHPAVATVAQLFGGGSVGAKGGPHLFKVGIWVPGSARTEFLDWYESEHLPILLENSAWGGCRFVEQQVSDGHQFYALHQLDTPAALNSEERRRSRATPWFMRLKRHSWFDEAFTRQLYTRTEV